MNIISKSPKTLLLLAAIAAPVSGSAFAQQDPNAGEILATVQGSPPADLSGYAEGPNIEGFISARNDNRVQITSADGTSTIVVLSEGTDIRASGGFLGLNRNQLSQASLLNGLPVSVQTVQWGGGLVASKIELKNRDLRTAEMIQSGTAQRFGEQGAAIEENAAATEALRGRVANIDQYNIRGTTNVYFDTGKWNLSPADEQNLCAAAAEAEAMDNALLLVVGYTDSVGDEDYNQVLSERRAGRVVNYLQQRCGWAPYRMLTPTGMAESDPLANNDTPEGRAQNRRVAVNILVSKAVEGI